MYVVVFSDEPGLGKAFISWFADSAEIALYEQAHGVRVMTLESLEDEVWRLRRWVKQAADEYNTAQQRLRHTSQMLECLAESVERVSV